MKIIRLDYLYNIIYGCSSFYEIITEPETIDFSCTNASSYEYKKNYLILSLKGKAALFTITVPALSQRQKLQ